MATDVERLAVLIEANTKSYERAMARIEQRTDKAIRASSKSVQTLDGRMKAAAATARTLAASFGIGIVAGGLAQLPRLIGDVVAEVSKLGKVADKVGLTVEALQELRFAAELTGVASNQLDMGMQRFSRRIAEAASGTGVLLPVLEANNIALRDSDGRLRSNTDLLDEYANLIKGAASEQDKLRLAFLAFDSEGAALVNMLKDGSRGLAELRDEAHKAGGVFDEAMVRKMEEVDDRFSRVSRTISQTFKGAIVESVDEISNLIDEIDPGLLSALKDLDDWVRTHNPMALGQKLGDYVRAALGLDPVGSGELTPQEQIAKALAAGGSSDFGGYGGLMAAADRAVSGTKIRPTKIPVAADSEEQKRIDKIRETVAALEHEASQVLRTAEAQELFNNLKRAGVNLDSEAGQNIAALTAELQANRAAMDEAARAQEAWNAQSQFFGDILTDGLSSIIVHGDDATETMKRLAAAVADAALQAALLGQGPLAGLFGMQAPATGGIGGILGSLFGGFRASGGPVSAGKAYVVGEKRPELFVPSTSGRIVPQVSDGQSVVLHYAPVISAGMQPMDRAWVSAQLERQKREMPGLVKRAFDGQRRNNPNFYQTA